MSQKSTTEQSQSVKRDVRHPEIPIAVESSRSVHTVTRDEKNEEPLPDEPIHDEVEQPELPKMWGLDDPFLYAPPKPDRDPWSILLEPLMEKDKIQCDAWKDEVQNLLIFAGLFSAVVTAFIIESYKTLQPDPNDTIITLLSVIATRLDNTNSTLALPSYASSRSSFSPTMSSIRINSFWFISLVLSLATVLVGIISLQWIREHQNYPRTSPRETYALFNMRAEGLERWHVPKIFTALPLLLQGALVLFLGGIVDFLLAFGDIVVIPVSIFTALVLLFLVATTVLPTLQGPLLYLPYPYSRSSKIPPAQCPYKSPQAHAFRFMLSSAIRLGTAIRFGRLSTITPTRCFFTTDPVAEYTWRTWNMPTWTEFDTSWLRLRNIFVQHSYHRLPVTYSPFDHQSYPIFDLVQGLMARIQSHDNSLFPDTLPAQYHCFVELSEWVIHDVYVYGPDTEESPLESNAYFRDLMEFNHVDCSAVLSHFFDINGRSRSRISSDAKRVPSGLLHEENIYLFFRSLRFFRPLVEGVHMMEIETRLSKMLVDVDKYDLHAIPLKPGWARCLGKFITFPFYYRERAGFSIEIHHDPFLWQWVNNFSNFFRGAAQIQPPYTPEGAVHISSSVVDYMALSADVDLYSIFDMTEGLGPAIQRKFSEIFEFITENLIEEMSSPDFHEPKVLFYVTALYLHAVRHPVHRGPDLPFHPSLGNLLLAVRMYKRRTIDAGIVDLGLQGVYLSEPDWYGDPADPARFSPEWWDFLNRP